jgi:hypothetical protein
MKITALGKKVNQRNSSQIEKKRGLSRSSEDSPGLFVSGCLSIRKKTAESFLSSNFFAIGSIV